MNEMVVLVVGASGATGRQLVNHLLKRSNTVKVIVRSTDGLPKSWDGNENVKIIEASVLDLTNEEMIKHVSNCSAVASCLGHNMTFKGVYGHPRKLVTEAVQRLCHAITANKPGSLVRFVLMNSSGNSNRDLKEPVSFAQKAVIGLLRLLLPPHVDNELAADYLRTQIGQNDEYIEWVAVRPDGLVDEAEVTAYEAYPSPIRSAIFDAGKISRTNVGHFMAELINDDDLWKKWKGQMPVLYAKALN